MTRVRGPEARRWASPARVLLLALAAAGIVAVMGRIRSARGRSGGSRRGRWPLTPLPVPRGLAARGSRTGEGNAGEENEAPSEERIVHEGTHPHPHLHAADDPGPHREPPR